MSDFSLRDEINPAFRCGQHPLNNHGEGVASRIATDVAAVAAATTAAAAAALAAAAAAAAAVAAAAFAAIAAVAAVTALAAAITQHPKPQKHGYPSPCFGGGITTRT